MIKKSQNSKIAKSKITKLRKIIRKKKKKNPITKNEEKKKKKKRKEKEIHKSRKNS